ncbi:Hypothetical protein PHPALM_5172 [Phytophthora palmivora]|uniref:Uncharacterized protein n=1 Tax=Phytophthora palmivora TaxID=4796 RepID=A0A2P4YI42_9STRA|nr:Hypothetical protein PHPALM_5172 [Phytophthora palmivora]
MPGFTVDSDADVEMTVPQSIFELIRAPELRSWEHGALIEWHREWERYVEKIRHRCGITNVTIESVVTTVKSSVRPKTLWNMATYVLKKPLSAVTDTDILEAVLARCRTLKNEFVPDVTSLFGQKLEMDLSIDDCDAQIFRYYEDFNGIVEDNGLQGLIGTGNDSDAGYKSRLKARCRLLVDGLQPPVLKAQITRLIDLEKRNCKSDDLALFDLILEHAKVQQRFHRMSQDYAKRGDSKSEQNHCAENTAKPPPAEPTRSSPPAASPPPAPIRTARPSRPPPQDRCLVCKGPHWLKDLW